MPIDFNALNLKIMDISTNISPDMYVNINGVTFTKKVIHDMNYPAYVQFVTDIPNKIFGIRASRHDGHNAEPFSKTRKEQKTTINFGSKNIWEPIRKMMEGIWNPNKRYKVTGYLLDDRKTMIFALEEGVEEIFREPKESLEK